MKSVKEIIEFKFKKYKIDYSEIYLGYDFLNSHPQVANMASGKMGEEIILASYPDKNNWLCISENKIAFLSLGFSELFNLAQVDSVKADIAQTFNEGKDKFEISTVELKMVSGNTYLIKTGSDGAAFFLSDMIKIASDKKKLG